MELGCCAIVEPSVAAAMEISDSDVLPFACSNADIEPAVWYESIDISESVGVRPWAPMASGRAVRSSEPFGLCAGRIVRMDDSDEASAEWETGSERTTVVLYSECADRVLSNKGRSLPSQ